MSIPVTVIVPSLDPDEKLLRVIRGIAEAGFARLILVNDGSKPENTVWFEKAAELALEKGLRVEVLRHAKNLGKGRGLKNAFNHYLCDTDGSVGVVTADGDDQHTTADIVRCAQALLKQPDTIFLGCRNFSLEGIPARSRFGNRMTSLMFRMACGMKLSDTQTGLRAIPNTCLSAFLDLEGERFEYETNMLLEMKRRQMPYAEVSIDTVYIEENKSSHFRPLIDSMRILRVLSRFLLSAGASFLLDIGLFVLFGWLLRRLPGSSSAFAATILARIFSSVFNFTVNKNLVFQNRGTVRKTAVRYYALCAVQMLCSATLVAWLVGLAGAVWSVPLKLLVDVILFFISFQIQQGWVFRE